jgi:hypothetical protein
VAEEGSASPAEHNPDLRDEHFQRAADGAQAPPVAPPVAPQACETGKNGPKPNRKTHEKTSVFRGSAEIFGSLRTARMGDEGLRTTQGNPVKTLVPAKDPGIGGAYVVHSARSGVTWAEVRALILACSEIPEATRGELVALGDQRAGGR